MRRLVCLLLLMSLLSGCLQGGQTMQDTMDFRARLQEAGGCSFEATVQAQYEGYADSFALDCSYDAGTDNLEFTVLAPTPIAGIAGQVARDRRTVTFADTALELELLAGERIAPVALPQVLAQSWAGSYIASAGRDRDYTVAVFQNGYEDDTLQIECWFSDGVPVYADVWYQGRCQAGVEITDFSFQK